MSPSNIWGRQNRINSSSVFVVVFVVSVVLVVGGGGGVVDNDAFVRTRVCVYFF